MNLQKDPVAVFESSEDSEALVKIRKAKDDSELFNIEMLLEDNDS